MTSLPKDLLDYLASSPTPFIEAGCYETVRLRRPDELRLGTLEVTPNLAPWRNANPHLLDYGHYAVPAVNLVREDTEFPAWLFLYLPGEARYGTFDLDHGDLMVYDADVAWSDVAADPERFVQLGESGGGPGVEYLRPWPKYPWVAADG